MDTIQLKDCSLHLPIHNELTAHLSLLVFIITIIFDGIKVNEAPHYIIFSNLIM